VPGSASAPAAIHPARDFAAGCACATSGDAAKYHGKDQKITSVQLMYSAPAGKATLNLHP